MIHLYNHLIIKKKMIKEIILIVVKIYKNMFLLNLVQQNMQFLNKNQQLNNF